MQDAIIARFHYFQSTMLPASKQLNYKKRFDFSDPQGGKGSCDGKASTIKGHMRTHLN